MNGKKWRNLSNKVKLVWFIKGVIITAVLLLFFGTPFILVLRPLYFTLGVVIAAGFILLLISVWIIMFYNRYTYLINDDGVEIRRGILWKKDVTIPYNRIQNIDIDRGPIEQLVGIYKMNIFTAGTGSLSSSTLSSGMFGAEGYLPGIDNPGEIRDRILFRVKESDENGFGVRKKDVLTEKQLMKEILSEVKQIRKNLD